MVGVPWYAPCERVRGAVVGATVGRDCDGDALQWACATVSTEVLDEAASAGTRARGGQEKWVEVTVVGAWGPSGVFARQSSVRCSFGGGG